MVPWHCPGAWCSSDAGLAGRLGPQCSGPAKEREGGPKAPGGHDENKTGPGAKDGPPVPVIYICRQTVDEGRVPGQVVADTGCIGAQGDGAEDP